MDAITGIQKNGRLPEGVYLLLPMTHVQMHSQNTSAHLFPPCKYDCSRVERHCGERRHRHESAAQACRHILPAFSNASLVGFSPQMQNDMEAARTWVKMFAEQDCMSGKVLEALRQLAVPLPPHNDTNECLEKKEIGPCNPIEAEKETHGVQDDAFEGYLLFSCAMLMSEIVFLFIRRRNLSSERFKISARTIPLLAIMEGLVAALLVPSDALFKDAAFLEWDEKDNIRAGFVARLGRLISAIYIQLSSVPLLSVRREGEETALREYLDPLRNHWIVTAAMQFYRSISFGGRFHKLALVGYELSEVPAQLYALNKKAAQNDLPNSVIMTAVALISINMILTPALLYMDVAVAVLLMVDVALDSCIFVLNTAVIGASPENMLTDISIWLPAISISGIILAAFQPRRLDQTGIEWAENPSNDASYDVARIVTEEASVGEDAEEGRRESIRCIEMQAANQQAQAFSLKGQVREGGFPRHSCGKLCPPSVGRRTRQRLAVAAFTCLGVVLFTSTVIRGSVQYHACIEEHGEGWTCSVPQAHFGNVILRTTSCATRKLLSLSCGGMQFAKLPNMALFTDVTTIDVSGNKRLASLPYEILEIMNTSTKVNATGSPAYSSIDWSDVPHFQLSQGSELRLICRQIKCERIRLRRNGLHDLSAVLSWMDAGAASWKYVDLSGNHFKSLCGKTCDVALQECGRVRENTQQCASSISNVQRWGDLRRIDLRFNNISGLCNNGAAILYNLLLGKGGRDMVPLNGNPLHMVTLDHVDSEVSMAAVNISTIEKYTCESCDGNKHTTEKILSMRQLKVLNISHMGGVECELGR